MTATLDVASRPRPAQQLGGVDTQRIGHDEPGYGLPVLVEEALGRVVVVDVGSARRGARRSTAAGGRRATVFCELVEQDLEAAEALVEEVLGLVAQAAGVGLGRLMICRARCSAARTTSVRCTIRSAWTRAASSSSSASRRVLATNSWRSLIIQRAWRSSSGRRWSASSSSSMISSRSMRGDDDSGIVGAVAMMSIARRSSVSASPT